MSKERLEEMRDFVYKLKMSFALSEEEVKKVDWLVEQAKRAEKLQDQIDDKILPEIEKGWTENKRYRDTLEFYSKEGNYSGYLTAGGWVKTPINDDNGEKARQALKGEL